MIKTKLVASAVALSLSLAAGIANADVAVIGNLKASSSVVVNPGAAQQTLNSQATPYLKGDVVSTVGASSARVALSSGKGNVTVAPDSIVSISDVAPLQVEIQQGGVQVEASSGESVKLITKVGSYELKSDLAISAVAVFENEQLAVVSKGGELVVESGDSVTKVSASDAFVVGVEQPANVVDVQALGFGTAQSTILTLVGIGATILIVDEVVSDDDDPASPR